MIAVQISLTKKLATAMGIKPANADETVDPLFCWTANWTNTFENQKEDTVVMVNGATRFTVTIFGVKRNQFKNITEKMIAAIKNTLLAMNLSSELVDEYIRLAGDITYTANHDRKMTACVNHQGLDAAFTIGRAVNESRGKIKYEDTLGKRPLGYGNTHEDSFIPASEMIKALTTLTGKPAYRYRAFELLVTLDLEIYKAARRLIVPADISFQRLHEVLQRVFDWKNYHLFDFAVYNKKTGEPCARLVPDEESLSYDDDAVLIDGRILSEYLPKHKFILYTYDMGDSWEHQIELIRVIDVHDADSPWLLEAIGQAPPEDVGGVGGFINFREIMLNPNHPEYAETKDWAGYWSPELREWEARPKIID